MARSFSAMNDMYRASEFKKIDHIYSQLRTTDQAMTFKELGVISDSGEIWRPKVTKLFNFIKKLVLFPGMSPRHDIVDLDPFGSFESNQSFLENGHFYLASSIELPNGDPIFKSLEKYKCKPKVIGTTKVKTSGH
jgi:hypothetical protein